MGSNWSQNLLKFGLLNTWEYGGLSITPTLASPFVNYFGRRPIQTNARSNVVGWYGPLLPSRADEPYSMFTTWSGASNRFPYHTNVEPVVYPEPLFTPYQWPWL